MITPFRHTPLLPGTLMNLFFPPEGYTYFARTESAPFATGDMATKAAWAADAAMLAYARYGTRFMTDAELAENFGRGGLAFEKIGGAGGDWNAHGTQAVFASCDSFALMAFRGTELQDPLDALTDDDVFLVHEPEYRGGSGEAGVRDSDPSLEVHLFPQVCFVHRGFQKALNGIWEAASEAVTKYRGEHPGAEVCFAGHSLGGGLAVLAYSRFAGPEVSLYTVGCPRVGNGAFRDRVMANPGRGISRIVNCNDAITHTPTDSPFYRQTPTECQRFDADGNLQTDGESFLGDVMSLGAAVKGLPASFKLEELKDWPAPPSVVDHSPSRYCFRLWDCVA